MNLSKLLLLSSSLLFGLGLASCGEDSTQPTGGDQPEVKTHSIKVWCAEEIVELTKTQLNNFLAENKDVKAEFVVEPQGEASAASKMTQDPEAGADIYCFPQDQLARLISSGSIAKVGGQNKTAVQTNNDAGSVQAATVGEYVYAYPITSDNGYFMYYDKSVVSESSIDDLSKIIADVKAKNKFISYNLSEDGAWYNAGFFFAAGCESTWTTNKDGFFTSYVDTFNTENGLIAMQGLKEIITSGCWVNSATVADFNSDSSVVISGTWDYTKALSILGDNLGVADLPSYTVNEKSYHIGSFQGYKLIGVKPQPQSKSDKLSLCHKIANYLSSEKCQLERFNAVSWGPSNLNAQKTNEVANHPALKALFAQNEYAVQQGQYPTEWWTYASSIGATIAQDGTNADLAKILKDYAASLDSLLSK